MRYLAVIPMTLAVLALTACEDEDKEGLEKACGAAPAALKTSPKLPGAFPTAKGVVYTSVSKDGPATIAAGYMNDTIGPAHDAYVAAVSGASGYSVTKEEQDAADAEVNFSGAGNSGQVKLLQTCKTRTNVTITIRPA